MTDSSCRDGATLWDLVTGSSAARAVGAPGRPWLSGRALAGLAAAVREDLAGRGLGLSDRVALVLPNGPEAATAFLCLGASCCIAPLNPAYTAADLAFSLADLAPSALVLWEADRGPARGRAEALGIPVVALRPGPDGAPAGSFSLAGPRVRAPMSAGGARPGDPALMLHTSGTTARPKRVLLSNGNVAASAANVGRALALGPGDLCLNVMPLFHIHGLVAAVTASVAAGAAVWCAPGFSAVAFGRWLAEARPTWYTAVPTMHQAILARLRGRPEEARAAALRFVRSSSAALPPRVMAELEALFGCPTVEAYGMTEAAHQIACNPLPPGRRKPGTVGLPAGPEIRVVDAAGAPVAAGALGEVAIRGANVAAGYENDPAANAAAFADGWLRTGDQGRIDADGYLVLTGRLKEQINRGGEKVSPLEVDVALLDHPAVAQACTFALPHPLLGEEVAAVVVPRPGADLDEATVRAFAAGRLAAFKVPRRVLVMDDIPKGPTGKVQRVGMAARLGLGGAA